MIPMMEKAKNWDVLERTSQNKSSLKKSASHSASTRTGASPVLIVGLFKTHLDKVLCSLL